MDKNDIILDFFSGSATTAHAVMQLNAEDGGKRKFIMVQLPEACDEKSEALQSRLQNHRRNRQRTHPPGGQKIKDRKTPMKEGRFILDQPHPWI